MNSALYVIKDFMRLHGQMKKNVVLIIMIYLKVSWLIRYYPLRKYYHTYFLHDHITPFDFAPYRQEVRLLKKVLKQMPGHPSCLKESLTVHLFFKRKGLNIPLFLGVKTDNEFLAHAWYDQPGSNGFNRINTR